MESHATKTFETTDYERYRSLSLWSVVCLIVGLLSLTAIILPGLLFLSAIGVVCGLLAIWQIRSAPDEWAGSGMAIAGLGMSLLSLVAGSILTTMTYLTELPDGYQRLSFSQLKPGADERQLQIPSAIQALDGQRVFIKGYVLSSDKAKDLKEFILVPDMGTCCFGGQPKLTDMIDVTLEDPLRVRYSWQRRKLGGVLRVDPRYKREDGSDGAHYKLQVDYVR